MAVFLAIVIVASIALSCVRFGWASPLSLGLLALTAYTLPALIGWYAPFYISFGAAGYTLPVTTASQMAYGLFWMVILLCVLVSPTANRRVPIDQWQMRRAARTATVLAVLGYCYFAATLGPDFFLQDRKASGGGAIMTLWRWTFCLGLLLSIASGARFLGLLNAVFLTIYFLQGDRTVLAITLAAALGMSWAARPARIVPRLRHMIYGAMATFVLLAGKPIYMTVKNSDLSYLTELTDSHRLADVLFSFEPMSTYAFLEYVISRDVTMPLISFWSSIIGNLLIFPSIFGVDTNYFNTFMTNLMPSNITYGLAGSYIAHAYVALGVVGLMLFAAIFVASLVAMQRAAVRADGFSRAILICLAATVGVYCHRNGLDNVFSFVRQILIVGLAIYATQGVLGIKVRLRSRRATMSRPLLR